MFLNEFFNGLVKSSSGVLLIIPFARADVFEKPGDLIFIFQDLPIKISGIPVDQDITKIENDRVKIIVHYKISE
jgi:hypothetical protein